MFVIEKIEDDGSIVLRPVGMDGKPHKKAVKTTIDDFIGHYTKTQEERAMVKIDPHTAFETNAELITHGLKCSIWAEMHRLHVKHACEVLIVEKPERIVLANRAYAAGAIKMIIVPPACTSFMPNQAGGGPWIVKHVESGRKFSYKIVQDKTKVSPAAWVGAATVKSAANMEIGSIASGLIEVPILTNSTAVKIGDALVRYIAPKRKVVDSKIDRSMPQAKIAKTDRSESDKKTSA